MKRTKVKGMFVIGVLLIVMLVAMSCTLTGCNQQVIDTTWNFDKAIISLPNGEIVEGEIDSWKDFEDADQVQVKIDGVTYYTHIENVVLIAE